MATKLSPVRYANFWLNRHYRDTGGFSRPFSEYSTEELVDMWFVTDWLLGIMPYLMNVVFHQKHKPELRRAICYLTELQQLQKQAHGYDS